MKKETFEADFTVVFPHENLRYNYGGIVQIDNEELIIFIHYEVDNKDVEYLSQIQLFNRTINDFYVQINRSGYIANIINFTCFGCYCITPFVHHVFLGGENSAYLPATDSGLIEVRCNSWIENAICEDTEEREWESVKLDIPFLENWADCDSGSYDFPIDENTTLSIVVGIIKKWNHYPPQSIEAKSVSIFCTSKVLQSIEELHNYAFGFFLFIRFATNIELPQGSLSFAQKFEDFSKRKDCQLHFDPTYTTKIVEYPKVNDIISMPIPLSTIQEKPYCIFRWYECFRKNRTSLALLARVLGSEYLIDRSIIYLVQIFDGLQKGKTPPIEKAKFNTWREKVVQNAIIAAQEIGIEELNNYKRLEGALSNLNKQPLKRILSDFIYENYSDKKAFEKVGGIESFLRTVIIFRHGASHGNYMIPKNIDGEGLYYHLGLMKSIVRVYINKIIIGID